MDRHEDFTTPGLSNGDSDYTDLEKFRWRPPG